MKNKPCDYCQKNWAKVNFTYYSNWSVTTLARESVMEDSGDEGLSIDIDICFACATKFAKSPKFQFSTTRKDETVEPQPPKQPLPDMFDC